jgi:hypothetical protein
MKTVVLQSNYFPWRGYFDLILQSDTFIFYDEVKYTKNDWRNRNVVTSDKGKHWITIPVSSESVHKKISEVTLDYKDDWRKSHQSLLQMCYGKDPLYKKQLRPFSDYCLFELQTNSLSELNQEIIKKISQEAGFKTTFRNSNEFQLKEGKVDRLINLLRESGTTEYISGPAAKDYLKDQEDQFTALGIKLTYYSYPCYRGYGNTKAAYEKSLSILDYLAFEPIKDLASFLRA